MQTPINQIQLKDPNFRGLKLQNFFVEKEIYKLNQRCDVKFIRLEQEDPINPKIPQEIKVKKYSLKTIYKQKMRQRQIGYEKEYDGVYNQIFALYMVDHPNIAKLYWHYEDQNAIYLLMEYGGIKLHSYSRKNNLNEEQIKQIFHQICLGVHEIHQKNIMHRELSLYNIVISAAKNNIIKIIDFDHVTDFTGGRQSSVGDLFEMAPQVYYKKRYNSKADIWSLGIILYCLFHKKSPFEDLDEKIAISEDEQSLKEIKFVERRDKLQYSMDNNEMSQDAKKIIKRMLSLNPQKRPSITQILNSKWLTGNEDQKPEKEYQNFSNDDKKTMQIPNNDRQVQNNKKMNEFQQSSIQKEDDFVFDKLINKITMDNTLQEIQERYLKLVKVRAEELTKKKELILKYLAIEKKKIQQDKNS